VAIQDESFTKLANQAGLGLARTTDTACARSSIAPVSADTQLDNKMDFMRLKTRTLIFLALLVALLCLPALAMVQAAPPATVASLGIATKVIAIAGVLSTLIQAVKSKWALTGHVAIGLNVVGTVAASLALANPGDFKTPGFWVQVGGTVLATAGVHDLASFIGLFKSGK